jgi:hypothetical protein
VLGLSLHGAKHAYKPAFEQQNAAGRFDLGPPRIVKGRAGGNRQQPAIKVTPSDGMKTHFATAAMATRSALYLGGMWWDD